MRSTRLATLCVALGLALFFNPNHLQSQTVTTNAIDNAGNYGSGWTNGANGGTGFGPWSLSSGGGAAGSFVGDPSSAGITGMNPSSFGLYANGGGSPYVNVERTISNSLAVGQTLSFKWSINFDSGGSGNKGFNLLAGTNEIFNINNGGSAAITLNGTDVNFNYGAAAMTWSFTRTGSNSIFISANGRDGSGSLSTNVVVSNASIDKIKFYANSLQSGDTAQPYFNDFLVFTTTADIIPPVVTLSQKLVAVPVNGTYTADAGRTATDEVDGAIPLNSITNNASTAVNLAAAGTYTVRYSATDAANNTGTATQTVVVYSAGTFASQYSSIQAVGQHNGWNFSATATNSLRKTANFQWKLLHYFPGATNTAYLINANAFFPPTIKWGAGGVRGAGDDASLSPTVDTSGWYAFTLDEAADTGGLAKVAAADNDGDGMPDEWEAYFGAQLATATNNLDPAAVYNSDLGGTKTALEAYQTGDNPVQDLKPPTLAWASGITAWSAVAIDSTPGAQIIVTEEDVVATGDSPSEILTPSPVVLNLLKGPSPGVKDAIDLTTDGLWRADYVFTDPSGNAATNSRIVAVGSPEPEWRKLQGPRTNTISTIGSATAYGRIFIPTATAGAGQVPNIVAELGVIANGEITNAVTANPSTWTAAGIWREATYNPGFTGGDDEYQATINGSDLAPGTYSYAFRFKVGDTSANGTWRYAGVNAAGTDGGQWTEVDLGPGIGGPYTSATLVVNAAQVRNVTFAVNMGVQRELGTFNPDSDKVYLVGEVTNWATGVEMVREGSTDVFKLTLPIEGALDRNFNYKFKSGAAGASNGGYEGDVNPDAIKEERVLTLAAVDSPQILPVSFFNNEEEVRSLTFKVDLGVQISKSQFVHGDTLEVRFGDFNAGGKSLTREGSTTVYSGTFPVAGDAGGNFQYKFWRTNSVATTQFERVDAPRNNDYLNRSYTLGANGVAATLSPTPFFSNDDGVGPVITLTGLNTVNLNVGDSYSDAGATAVDAAENTTNNLTGISTVNTAVEGSYTVIYNATDAAGNAATPVTRTVVVAAPVVVQSTYAEWSGGATLDSAGLAKYAIGGASSLTANDGVRPTTALTGGFLVITAIVRTDNSDLTVVGQAVTDLANYASGTGVTTVNGVETTDQTGVPTGHKRKTFSVAQGSDARKFMRLSASLALSGTNTTVSVARDSGGATFLQVTGATAGTTGGGTATSDKRSIYYYAPDTTSSPTFSGGFWPYVIVQGQLSAGAGVTATLTKNSSGVLLVNGRPAYQYGGDNSSTTANGVGGAWPAMRADGTKTTTGPSGTLQ